MNKYLARLKTEKHEGKALPKLTKGGYGSYVSAKGTHNSEKIVSIQKNIIRIEPLPQWQHNFCIAHAMFNNWRGCCPLSLDDCLVSKIIDSDGHIDKLKGLNIGHGIATDDVIQQLLKADEPESILLKNPCWWVCLAENLYYGRHTTN